VLRLGSRTMWHIIDKRPKLYIYIYIYIFVWRFDPIFRSMVLPDGASRPHSLDTPQSVGLLCTSDQPDAETSTSQHTQQTNIHAPGGIRTHKPSKRATADPQTARSLGSAKDYMRTSFSAEEMYVGATVLP
jgi:hypothetical protein